MEELTWKERDQLQRRKRPKRSRESDSSSPSSQARQERVVYGSVRSRTRVSDSVCVLCWAVFMC